MQKRKNTLAVAFSQTLKLYPSLFRYWPVLIGIHLMTYLISEGLSWEQEAILNSGREELLPIFLVFSASTIADVVLTTTWIIVVVKVIQALTQGEGVRSNLLRDLNRALIEATRALARMLRWLPLLLLPALVKFVRLCFVPFIVVDSDAYKQGSVDALNQSEKIISKRFWLVLFSLVLSTGLPALPSLVFQGENISLASRPGLSITWSVFEFFTSLLATTFLFCLYRQLAGEQKLQGA